LKSSFIPLGRDIAVSPIIITYYSVFLSKEEREREGERKRERERKKERERERENDA